MDPLLLLIALTLTGTFAFGGLYAYQETTGPARTARRRMAAASQLGDAPKRGILVEEKLDRPSVFDRLPISAKSREKMADQLLRAHMQMRVSEFIALRLGFAVGVAFLVMLFALSQNGGFTLLLMLGGGLGGWLLPALYVSRRINKRRDKIEAQLPEALTSIAKSLRAGSGLMQALAYASKEVPDPLGPELASLVRDIQLGVEPEDAFADLSRRVVSKDIDIVVTAIIIQRTAGGNMAEILSNVSHTIRERVKLYGDIKVLVSKQQLMGNIVACVPVGVALLTIFMNPQMGDMLLNTILGRIALGVALAFELLGIVVIRKMAQIEV